MPQSLVQLYVHIVFSTKQRRPFFRNRDLRQRIHAYLATVSQNQESPPLIVGGTEDHGHLLCRISKVLSIARLIQELKRDSSKWIKQQFPRLHSFYWQAGYGAFSVGHSHIETLVDYIKNQEEHHKHESFQGEFRCICRRYGLRIDERYVWD